MKRQLLLGLDISSSYICLAFADSAKNFSDKVVFKLIEKKPAESGIFDSEIADRVEKEIIKTEKSLGKKVSKVYFCFDPQAVQRVTGFSQRVIHPRHSVLVTEKHIKDSLERARLLSVDWSYECLHSFALQFNLDGKTFQEPPLGIYGRRLGVEAVFYVCSRDYFLNVDNFFQHLGKKRSVVVLRPLAKISSLKEKQIDTGDFLFVDIGKTNTCISYFQHYVLQDIKSLCHGADKISEEVSGKLNIPWRLAEEIKVSYGSLADDDLDDSRMFAVKRVAEYNKIERKALNQILYSSYKNILGCIKEYIDSRDYTRKVDFLILSGGACQVKGFSSIAEHSLGVPVKNIPSHLEVKYKDPVKFQGAFGLFRFFSSRFCSERAYRFPKSLLRRVINVWEEYF